MAEYNGFKLFIKFESQFFLFNLIEFFLFAVKRKDNQIFFL